MAPPELLAPEEVVKHSPEEADLLLDRLEATVPVRSPFESVPPADAARATVFGDTHGDWRSTVSAARAFVADPKNEFLVGLGDYVDRPPLDCPEGSVANVLYLLQLAGAHPDRVYLLQGNHETHRRIAVLPHSLPEEIDALWGPVEMRYERVMRLLERGALALTTGSGVYLAHAGFPREPTDGPFPSEFSRLDDDAFIDVVWGEAIVGRTHRGFVRPFDQAELELFLERSGARIFLRGHDPDLTGRPLFGDRCLTLHTCRIYERFGGVIVARFPMGDAVSSVADVSVEHLDTEGRSFLPPE